MIWSKSHLDKIEGSMRNTISRCAWLEL